MAHIHYFKTGGFQADPGPFMPMDDEPQPVLDMSSELLEFHSPGTVSERAAGAVRLSAP